MIVKIWPIKEYNMSSRSKISGLKNAVDYVSDPEKVIAKDVDLGSIDFNNDDFPSGYIDRSITYMKNEDKTEVKYVSGYRCNVDNVLEEFEAQRRNCKALRRDKSKSKNENIAFHIVQSFPQGLDISDEEVHQCGLELCQKLGKHQALVCSHVHPVIDEKGIASGKCKHNHILINAYIHADDYDPEHCNRIKYNDCKATYAQLRIWNDEIAMDHGLPIIRNPDMERSSSWFEEEMIKKGCSWKERIRNDIESARRISGDWERFVAVMENAGYKIRDGVHTSYTTPDKAHKIRGKTLGRQYTKEALELYWSLREFSNHELEKSIQENQASPLTKRTVNASTILSVGVPIGGLNTEEKVYYYLPLADNNTPKDSLESYFDPEEMYDVFDENRQMVTMATGAEVLRCFDELNRSREEPIAEDNRKKFVAENEYFIRSNYINTKTMRPYRTSLYDENGRRRSVIELIFILAAIILKNEGDLWTPVDVPKKYQEEIIFAPVNWKIQNMLDSIRVAKEEGIEKAVHLDTKLQSAGSLCARTKGALKRTREAKEKMEDLNAAIVDFKQLEKLVTSIEQLDDGSERDQMKGAYSDSIAQYNAAKATMQRFKVTSPEQIEDFEERYKKVSDDIEVLSQRLEKANQEYRKLKKLEWQFNLAQNEQYIYGPNFSAEKQKTSAAVTQPKEKQTLDEMVRAIEKKKAEGRTAPEASKSREWER